MLSKSNPELKKAFNNANEEWKRILSISPLNEKLVKFKSFFQQITSNAKRNALKQPHGTRHSKVVKKFARSLFLHAASMAYHLVHENMPTPLPCLYTVQESIYAAYHSLSEVQFWFDELANYLKKFDALFTVKPIA